jgi:hypothetical protein
MQEGAPNARAADDGRAGAATQALVSSPRSTVVGKPKLLTHHEIMYQEMFFLAILTSKLLDEKN